MMWVLIACLVILAAAVSVYGERVFRQADRDAKGRRAAAAATVEDPS